MTATRHPAKLRVALVGYGLAGESFHAPLIVATPGLRLSTIVTSNPERMHRAHRRHPGVRILTSADELWRAPFGIDLVVIATPNRMHVPLALAALQAGLPVVVDKPLAPSAAEAEMLVNEAERLGVPLTVYQNRRWDGDFLTVRRLLEEGELGRVVRFESRFERWRPTPKWGWRESAAPEEAGGILFDLGSHLIDQAVMLFGTVKHVYAEVTHQREGVEVDDDTFVALTHLSGVRSHLWMSAVAGQPGPRMRVLGTRAAYTKKGMDVQEAALRAGRPVGPNWGEEPESQWGTLGAGDALRPVPTERGAYTAFYAGMAAALREGAPVPVPPRDAVYVLRVIEAARRSASEGQVVAPLLV